MDQALIEPLGKANTHALTRHLTVPSVREDGMALSAGSYDTQSEASRDFRAAIDAGTSRTLV